MMPRVFMFLRVAGALLLLGAQASAQDNDPLSLADRLTGHDPAGSRQVLADHYAGIWQVVHTAPGQPAQEGGGRRWPATAEPSR